MTVVEMLEMSLCRLTLLSLLCEGQDDRERRISLWEQLEKKFFLPILNCTEYLIFGSGICKFGKLRD